MSNEYTWEQIAEAIEIAGGSPDKIKSILETSAGYPTAMQGPDEEGQEKLEPRAPAEKEWADRHTINIIDRPDAERQDGVEDVDVAAAPVAPTAAPKPEASVSFNRIRQMMSS